MFRYSADILPIGIITGLFALDVAMFFVAPWYVAVPWAIAMLPTKFCICAWNHHHQHVATFKPKLMNRALEVMYAFQTGALPLTWELHHNAGHHVNYLDQSKDESAWKTPSGRTMGVVEYSTVVSIMAYPRMWKKARAHAVKRSQFLTWATIVGLLFLAALIWNPIGAVALFGLSMVFGLYVTAWHTYYHHAGLDTDDKFAASWNILHGPYNVLMGNLGYHTAHHVRCSVHWSELPAFHATIADQIPANLYRRPCFPFNLLGRAHRPNVVVPAEAMPAK